ncbi:CHASE3 domain-containing protein [Sulfitobacter sp. LCG007]
MSDSLGHAQSARRFSPSNIQTKPKVLLAAAVPLVMAIVIGSLALVNLSRIQKTSGWVEHTHVVLSDAAGIVAAAVDMETGLRGYLLAGQEDFLAPYDSGSGRAFTAMADLQETVSDNPGQVARLKEAESVLREWQTDVAEPMIALRRQIGNAQTMNDMAAEVRKGDGKVYFDNFRGLISTFIEREQTLLVERREKFETLLARGTASASATRDALFWVTHTNKVILMAKDILAAAVDMETGMRGFLIAGDEDFLEPLNAGNAEFQRLITVLQETVNDNPPQVAVLAEAEQTINDWFANVVTPMLDLRRQIGTAETMDDMADLVGEARGKVYFDGFRQLMAEFSAAEAALMTSRQAANESTYASTVAIVWGALIAAIVFGVLNALFIGSSIGNAIRDLTSRMVRLADGDNGVDITGQDRGDEIGEMARATEVFKQNAIRVTALNNQREEDSKRMAEMAEEREKASRRDLQLAREKEEADRKQAAEREEMMRTLEASFGTVVESAVAGEFSKRVDAQFDDRILNDLATSINQLMSVVDQGLAETGRVLERVAGGDLSREMEGEYQGAFGRLQGNVNGMIGALKTLILDIAGSGHILGSSSAELRDTANRLSKQAEQNAASLEQTSAALEQLTASIKHVSGNVKNASENASRARDTARSSEAIATEAAESMQRIADASREITRVVGVINDIAFQINLLALNAGVEAARAGDAGRGFSVVASEVRQLAQRASDAAKEIGVVISKSDEAVTEGVTKVGNARSSLEAIAESVVEISKGVDEISTAIVEQATGITEITAAVGQIDQSTQQQAASFEEVTAASGVLASEADNLQKSTASFHVGEDAKVVPMRKPESDAPKEPARKMAAAGGSAQVGHGGWEDF